MSVSLNPSASSAAVPVESHPLSPEDLPQGGRRRPRDQQRPATSYFTAKRPQEEADEENGYAHQTYSPRSQRKGRTEENGYTHRTYRPHHSRSDWDGSVARRRQRSTQDTSRNNTVKGGATHDLSTRTSTLSLVWDRPSVPLFIVGSSTSSRAGSRPGTPVQQRPMFTLSGGENQTLHDLPARAASHVLTTPFHTLSDAEIQSAISDASVLSEEDNVSVQHPYHSALRVLSEAVDKLGRARVELEEGRRLLLEKQARVRELMLESSEPGTRQSVLEILDETTAYDSEYDSEDGEGTYFAERFSLKDSLSVALSEDLTPTSHANGAPSYTQSGSSVAPPDADAPDNQPAPSLLVSSESRGSLFTPSTDDLVPERSLRTPSPVNAPLPTVPPRRMKSRANSSASLASMSSTASKGLGDWMGWFGKARTSTPQQHQTREPSMLDSAITEDTASVSEDPPEEKPAEGDTGIKPTSTMRLLSALRMGSASPQPSPPKPTHKRKTSVNVLTNIPPSVLSSPILGAFNVPPPMPAPPVAVPVAVAVTEQHVDEAAVPDPPASIPDPEATSVLSSAFSPKEKDGPAPMQGATLRALSNATRVMTSDPSSILVDHGQDVGTLVAQLAWELVRGVRDGGVTFREPVKAKTKAKPAPLNMPEQTEEREDRKTAAVRGLTIAAAGGTLAVEKARKASALGALASPLLAGFSTGTVASAKTKAAAREDGVPPNGGASSSSSSNPNGASSPAPAPTIAGTLSVPLESIIPATAKPPTQYLARTYTSLTSPDFRPPSSSFTGDRFATGTEGSEPITDRYGFVYEVSSYDVLLLDRALRAGNSAPGCLTGIKVADREEDDDWPADGGERAREFEVVRGSCACVEGVRTEDEEGRGGMDMENGGGSGNGASEAASMVSTGSSKRSSKRTPDSVKPARTLSLSTPLKVASLDYLPAVEDGARVVPTHACPNTVRALVGHITDFHDDKQAKLKADWNAFLRRARRDMKPIKASASAAPFSTRTGSSSAAVMLGLGSRGTEDDVEELRQSEGLVGFSQMGLASNQNERKEFGRLVRGGIPLVYRAKVWLECSGALEMAEPGMFRDLLEDAVKEGGVAIGEIEKDVGRTMPLNVFFGGNGVGVDKLRRVLRAYSRRNPSVGYCQGMNLVASTLLLVHADEEDAFWNLACIIEKHLPEDFFSPSLLVSRACPLVLLDYVHDMMPALFDHLTHLGVDLPAICFSWFLSLFTDCLPVETLFRVWDVFIVDGLDVLFRIALAILRINETELLQAQSVPALYVALESLPTRMWEVDKLLKHETDLRPYVVNADIIKKRNARVKELKALSA